MPSTAVIYTVSSRPLQASPTANGNLPSIFEISYKDATVTNQRLTGVAAPNNSWQVAFTGTVGNMYHISARDIENPKAITTVTVYSGGSQVATSNNSADTTIRAGCTGTL